MVNLAVGSEGIMQKIFVENGFKFTSLGDLATFTFYTFSILLVFISSFVNFIVSDITDKFGTDKNKMFIDALIITFFDLIYVISLLPVFYLYIEIKDVLFNQDFWLSGVEIFLSVLISFLYLNFIIITATRTIVSNKNNKYYKDTVEKNKLKYYLSVFMYNVFFIMIVSFIKDYPFILNILTHIFVIAIYFMCYKNNRIYFNRIHLLMPVFLKYIQVINMMNFFLCSWNLFLYYENYIHDGVLNQYIGLNIYFFVALILNLVLSWILLLYLRYRDLIFVKKYKIYTIDHSNDRHNYLAEDIVDYGSFLILHNVESEHFDNSSQNNSIVSSEKKEIVVNKKTERIIDSKENLNSEKTETKINENIEIIINKHMDLKDDKTMDLTLNGQEIIKNKEVIKKIYINKDLVEKIEIKEFQEQIEKKRNALFQFVNKVG